MSDSIELLASVAVLRDFPEFGLVRGQVGTIVEILAPDFAEVEFVDEDGKTYVMAPLSVSDLMKLHHVAHEAA